MVDVAKKVKKKGCVTQYNFYKYPIKTYLTYFTFKGKYSISQKPFLFLWIRGITEL